MSYKQSPFPMMQGTKSHKEALDASPVKQSSTFGPGNLQNIVKTVGDASKTFMKNAAGYLTGDKKVPVVPKGYNKKYVKPKTPKVKVDPSKSFEAKSKVAKGDFSSMVTTGEKPMTQTLRWQKKYKKVKERRKDKPGTSFREEILKKKSAMTKDEVLAYIQQQRSMLWKGAGNLAVSAMGHSSGVGSYGDFTGILPTQEEMQRRTLGPSWKEQTSLTASSDKLKKEEEEEGYTVPQPGPSPRTQIT